MVSKPKVQSPTVAQIEELRTEFFNRLEKEGAPCAGGFHPKDLKRIKSTNIWLQRFLEEQDLELKASLDMLWATCEWRKNFGTNDLSVDNLNLDYLNCGLMFARNQDIDGNRLLIVKSKLHIRGLRNSDQLLQCFVYWLERMNRETEYDLISIFFDLAGTGLSNLDLDHTKQLVNILKYYYPNTLNYIFVFELPWILTAAFKIIKSLLPPKAVASLRFITMKNIGEYITEENMLTSWGGRDDYQFKFEPEKIGSQVNGMFNSQEAKDGGNFSTDENGNTTILNGKKVHFANLNPPESQMSDTSSYMFGGSKSVSENGGTMLKITPSEIITFTKAGNELIGTVDILNIVKYPITYKIKTTSPEKFRVRPSTGLLTPGSSVTINVVLQPGHNMTLLLNKDKFLVMCMEMTDSNASQQDITDLWKNTQNSSLSVEQHRLKCTIGPNGNGVIAIGANTVISDISRNGNAYPGSSGIIDPDRQWLHVSNSISQLVDTTRRLEARIKFNQKLQWITVFVFLLLSIAIVYILKIEINNNSSEYCLKSSRGYK